MNLNKFPWLTEVVTAYKNFNFPTSIIIEGESGLAKNHLANFFAQKLLCSDDLAPCGVCNSCNYFLAGTHPDFCFLSADSCSSILHSYSKANKDSMNSKKIEGVRALNEFVAMTRSVSNHRVAIIFDAHNMNINSQNALLKTLEELSENKHIFLVSNKRKYFLPTIYSRSNIITINNPKSDILDQWIADKGYIDYSTIDFAPDSTPLEIERLINNDMVGQYREISQNLNSYCLGEITTPDLIKFYKEINITFDEKINSIILFLKTCLGIEKDFYKAHPAITALDKKKLDPMLLTDLIEQLVEYKYQLIKVPSLNEQIGLNNFFQKIKSLFA